MLIAAASLALLACTACFSEHVTAHASGVDARAVCADPTTAGPDVVVIRNFAFQPATVRVAAGQQVTWVNCEIGGVPHSSTSDAAGWDSGLLDRFATFSRTFAAAGTFAYHCSVHPSMKASVIVQ